MITFKMPLGSEGAVLRRWKSRVVRAAQDRCGSVSLQQKREPELEVDVSGSLINANVFPDFD
jgi:hypothetical protein